MDKEELLKKYDELDKKTCTGCINCPYCIYCTDCTDCHDCTLCYNCTKCIYCTNLINGLLCKRLYLTDIDKNKYWLLNKEVSREEFENAKRIMR